MLVICHHKTDEIGEAHPMNQTESKGQEIIDM